MILGIGIDQCKISRLQRELSEPTRGFLQAVFLPPEIEYCHAKHKPAEHFAARFAAKEAIVKSLAGAQGTGTFWQDIEIKNTPEGQPHPILGGRLQVYAAELGVRTIHLSLTHTSDVAAAVAVAED